MKLAQTLKLAPHDNLKDGTVSYQYDSDTGVLAYEVNANASLFFIAKNFNSSGTAKIDAKTLLSASVLVGERIDLGAFSLTVATVAVGWATCNISFNQGSITEAGQAIFDLSQEYVSLAHIVANGKIYGFSEQLELIPV